MITKRHIREARDKEAKTCQVFLDTPWDKTSAASIYSALDSALDEELRGIPSVIEYSPISYDAANKKFLIEALIDVQDIDFEDEE